MTDQEVMVLLEQEEALNPGADLWILAELERSTWTQKIDWYLNFQILRSSDHQVRDVAPELAEVLNRWEVTPPRPPEVGRGPLMISGAALLPNHAVVVVPLSDDNVKNWAARVHQVWKDMDSPRLRIFLPVGVDSDRFVAAWPAAEDTLERAIVAEPN